MKKYQSIKNGELRDGLEVKKMRISKNLPNKIVNCDDTYIFCHIEYRDYTVLYILIIPIYYNNISCKNINRY